MDELKFKKASEIVSSEQTLGFVDWLMENCELSDDKSLWSYNSEDYTNEKLLLIYYLEKQDSEVGVCGKPNCNRQKLDNSPLCSYHWDIANS